MPVTASFSFCRPYVDGPSCSSGSAAEPSLQQVARLQVTDEPVTSTYAAEPILQQVPEQGKLQGATAAIGIFEELSLSEIIAFELQDEEPVPTKKRRLKATEKTKLRSAIATDVDKRMLCASIVNKVSSMVHIRGIDERNTFWEHCKTSVNFLSEMCSYFLAEYIKLHKQCDRGADKYALFSLTWYEQIHSVPATIAYLLTMRDQVTKAYNSPVTDDTWNTFVSTLLHVSFNEIQTIMLHCIGSIDEAAGLPTSMVEDDVALLRLGGWALFSCIQYRN